jgi:hypothetical protein
MDLVTFNTGDYGSWYRKDVSSGEWLSIDTRMLTRPHKDAQVLCPEHDEFFRDLIEDKLNRDFYIYSGCILHAWYHTPSNSLKLCWSYNSKDQTKKEVVRFGLSKAWKMYTKDINATVKTYHYNCGDIVSDSEDKYD